MKKKIIVSLFSIIIILIVIIVLVPIVSFFVNQAKFSKILKTNGYTKQESFYIGNKNGVRTKITVTKKKIFSMPEFIYENVLDRTTIEFHNLENDEENYIFLLGAPTNISVGKKVSFVELDNITNKEMNTYLQVTDSGAREEVSREEWIEINNEYIKKIKAEYNSIKELFN